jgi:hypothetical protein
MQYSGLYQSWVENLNAAEKRYRFADVEFEGLRVGGGVLWWRFDR